jgi:putative membrane protein
VFIVAALLSIVPTLEFLSWRKACKSGRVPAVNRQKLRVIKAIVHGELAAVVIISLCAMIMARGGWV